MGWQFWSQTIMIKNTVMTHDHHHDTLCWSRQHVSFVYRARFALSFRLPRESKILQWPSESWCRPSCMGMTVLDLNISNGERERETEIHSMTYIYIHAYTVLILIVNDSQGLTRVFFSVKPWCCIDCQVWLPTRRFITHIYEYIRYKTNNSLHCPPKKKNGNLN